MTCEVTSSISRVDFLGLPPNTTKYSCERVINISVRQIDDALADDVDSELTQRNGRGKKTKNLV